MSTDWTKVADAPLFGEHLLLGGIFDDDEPLLALPARYGTGEGERAGLRESCGLSDLSGMSVILVSGASAPALMAAGCAHDELAVGECSFGAVVTGDGSVASVPLAARTGDTEYLLVDPTERGLSLMPWLGFLAGIEQDGFKPFADTSIEDVSAALHPLLLWGPEAPAVLSDYLAPGASLPATGTVANVALDRIMCVIAAPACGEMPCYLLFVPPARARVLWRSFLSFSVVTPVGREALAAHARDVITWASAVGVGATAAPDHQTLLRHGLVRRQGGYVGERALKSR